jgi:hypothetical protein
MPTRVLDVECEPIRLFETNRVQALYMALSYNWGPGVKHEICARKATYDSLKESIDEAHMTRSHREAIMVARSLGYRYLWIDALCIIQDSTSDWIDESARMSEVYGNADLTLVAGRASDSRHGFLDNHHDKSSWDVELKYSRHDARLKVASACVATLPRSGARGPISQRAWCFQEDVLSTRQVVYMEEQIAYVCQECTWCENGESFARRAGSEGRSFMSQQLHRNDLLVEWYSLLQQYTSRSLFEPTDIFPALMGIAHIVQKRLDCAYIAGIWEIDLAQGLLWLGRNCVLSAPPPGTCAYLRRPVRQHDKPMDRQAHPRGPSWSWAAVDGPVISSLVTNAKRLDMASNRSLDNWYIKPLHYYKDGKPRWTLSEHCGVSAAFMPACTLEMLGTVALTFVSTKDPLVENGIAKWPWRFRRGCTNRDSALIKSSLGLTDVSDKVVALGIIDVLPERPKPGDTIYCMRLVLQQGLMLQKVDQNTYKRLGIFIVYCAPFFERLQETQVFLT